MFSVRFDSVTAEYGRATVLFIAAEESAASIHISRKRPDASLETIHAWLTLDCGGGRDGRVHVQYDVTRVRNATTGQTLELKKNTGRQRPVLSAMIEAFTGVAPEAIAFEESKTAPRPTGPQNDEMDTALVFPTRRYSLEVLALEESTYAEADIDLAETEASTRAARHACSVVVRRPQPAALVTFVTERARAAGEEPDGEEETEDPMPSRDPSILPALQDRIHDSLHAWVVRRWPSTGEA